MVGTVQTNADGERYVVASSVTPVTSSETVNPLGLNNKALGGGDYSYSSFPVQSGQKGVDSGTGLNNIGLLVRAWGTVSSVGSSIFKLTDGSGVDVYVESLLGGIPADTSYVCVTGVSSCKMVGDAIERVIRVDDPDNIKVAPGS